MASIPPNQTIYVQNLYEKLPKEGAIWNSCCSEQQLHLQGMQLTLPSPCAVLLPAIAELRKALYAMFSQFGKILDVVALKTLRLRGQAWIVFSDVAAATNAKNTMQGFPFFDKPIVSAQGV
jgi:hypothetical protein